MAGAVAFVLKGYPRLSETFIAQEMHGLEQLGLDIHIYSLRPPREAQTHPIHSEIHAPVTYLPERLRDEPGRVVRAAARGAFSAGFYRALFIWLGDMMRNPTGDRVRRFGQALVLADELDDNTAQLHAHFLHTPASVAHYASAMTGLRWSCSAHARDIWTTESEEKRAKLASLDWLVTCTQTGYAHLAALAPSPDKVELVYHGLDLDRMPAAQTRRPQRDGRKPDDPVCLLSIGRAVEKKGFDVLLDALATLDVDVHWRLVHIGDGDLLDALKEKANWLGLENRIEWLGALPQSQVLEHYRAADLFVLPCRIAADGDRDGLPNVLVEAQSQGLACLSTNISAIPELIEDGETGILVEADDAEALASALARLIGNPNQRMRLARAAAERVTRDFSHHKGIVRLAHKFGLDPATRRIRPAA